MSDPIFKDGTDKHESYGVVSLSRVQCGGSMRLFDSPFTHQHYVTLKVHRAERKRTHLHSDRISNDPDAVELIEVAMSEAQFARMITSANNGMGTPCTICRVNGERMPACPADGTKETYQRETVEEFEKAAKEARHVEQLVEAMMKKDRLTKADLKAVQEAASNARSVLDAQLPFLREQFAESMDKIVQQAKTEIEAHVNAVVAKTGLQGLKDQLPKLEGPKG